MNQRIRLRQLLENDETIVVPGVYDCVSAKIAEKLGFEAAFISGYSLEASVLGNPDIGLATKTDVVTHARYISRSVEIPIMCDSDTGYGNALNVWDTVREFEKTDIAGIEIEDQIVPKRCGYMPSRKLISIEEMKGKIEAALDARTDNDFMIIARTDARGVVGVDEAIKRCNTYLDAGAEMIIVAESYEIDELKKVVKSIKGPVGVAGGIPGRSETVQTLNEYRDMGVNMVIYGLTALYAAARAIIDIYAGLKKDGRISETTVDSKMLAFGEFNELIGLPQWLEIEKKFLRS